MSKKVLIVGGVAGGASAAARLRRLDETAEIIMFERDEYISFANCGLPYYIGESISERSKLLVQTPESMKARFNIDVRNHSEVLAVNPDKKTITVSSKSKGNYEESYDYLVLSPGAKAMRPKIPGIESSKILTLRNIPDTDKIKAYADKENVKRVVVIGGGFVGVEMAENLRERGLEVTLVEAAPHILAPFDYEMAVLAEKELEENGVDLILNDGVKAFYEDEYQVEVTLNSKTKLEADFVILAIGVVPDTNFLKGSGIELGARGHILVNEKLETSKEGIYAVGDAIEVKDFITKQQTAIPLAGPANKQGRIAADNIAGLKSSFTGSQGTSIIKVFGLTAASTGANERALKRAGIEYKSIQVHPASHASYYPGALPMTLKLIFQEDGKILGAQGVGYAGVDKRIDVIATVIRLGGTVEDLTELELSYAPPFSSAKDPVNMAGFVAQNVLEGRSHIVTWEDVKELNSSEYILLDVRSELEYNNGHVEGAINIPVDELRNRLTELKLDKTIVEYCQVGLRGYVADRILTQKGFKVLNVTGGYKSAVALKFKPKKLKETVNTGIKVAAASIPTAVDFDTQTIKKIDSEGAKSYDKALDACGLCCPGPLMQVKALDYSNNTQSIVPMETKDNKTMVVFSGDLDKAIASFIIANGAASMGKKVTMFFTFWGLNILRKPDKVKVKKGLLDRMFGLMMPRGSKKLKLSNMNMMGMGGKMIRMVMKNKNISSLEELIQAAIDSGIEIVACQMSMDVMGLKKEELIDGVKIGGVGYYLGEAEDSNVNLFI
ncbi:MAG: pyridine nucleotide-disulfide oxidoreductase [Herbinix sp.]|nr:pyridine nucleotide-disulfide oxidoreductase [Herbinix sp.]